MRTLLVFIAGFFLIFVLASLGDWDKWSIVAYCIGYLAGKLAEAAKGETRS